MPGRQGTINATTLGMVAGGALLAWSGLKGKSISNNLRALIAGQNPATANPGTQFPITGSPPLIVPGNVLGSAASAGMVPLATGQNGGYSNAQLQSLWVQAGGNPLFAKVMAAIAMAESGGNPTALNPNDNGGTQSSYGLWQISTGTHTAPSPNWSNPLENAKLAVQKFNSQGLGAWGTYTSGAYRQFLQ